ncbi:MAG: hypothetical protein ACYTGZ_21470 [Planctomycetota bacterium]|jgi:hypothetical protein
MKTTDLFAPRLVPGLALVVAVALLGAGCGSGGGGPAPVINDPPTLAFQTPTLDLQGPVGMVVSVTYTADDPDDEAMTSLYADRDGDILTTGDQVSIIKNQPEANGAVLGASWDTANVPEGEYHLIAVTDDGTNNPLVVPCPGKIAVWNTYPHDHTNIVLKDREGFAIEVGSTVPYSPRETCGACHDIDEISNGYHTQQGRTDEHGNVHAKDNFFNDGRTWLKSDGMYGKW